MAKPLLPDQLWFIIRPLMPPPKTRRFRHPGRKRIDDRLTLTGILFVLKTGIPWEELPMEMHCGSGMTCWRRLQAWHKAGVWAALHQTLLERMDDADRIDWSRAAVDSTFARAFGGVAGSGKNPTDRGRPGVKQHLLVDGNGLPLAAERTAANVPEQKRLLPLLDKCGPRDEQGRPKRLPDEVYGDRAYDDEALREALWDRKVTPQLAKRGTGHGSGLGVFRWVAERTISWLHGFRKLRFVTEKTVAMQNAFLNLAVGIISFRLWDAL